MRALAGGVPAMVLTLAPTRALAQHALLPLPFADPAYVQLAALERMGCVEARVSPHRPYLVGAVRDALRMAAGDPYCAGDLLTALLLRFGDSTPPSGLPEDSLAAVAPDLADAARRAAQSEAREAQGRLRAGAALTVRATSIAKGDFRPLWGPVKDPADGDPPAVAILRARASWESGDRLLVLTEVYGQTSARNDPQVRARALRRTSGVLDFSEAFVSGRAGALVVSVGRGREAWLGAGEESLSLSAHGAPLDRIVASIATKRFEARAIVASLDAVVLDTTRDALPAGTPPQRFYRTLVGHALTWKPRPGLELTLGETALLSRGSRTLDLDFANPVMIYIVTQNDAGRSEANRDNLTAFGALNMRVGGLSLGGELLVDDIQIDAADRKVTPDQLGWRATASAPLPLVRPASVQLEYRRVDSYTYLRDRYNAVYQQLGRPLGSELGPDADLLRGQAELWPSSALRLSGSVGYWRHGVRSITERPSRRAMGNAGKPFPSVDPGRYVQRGLLGDVSVQFLSTHIPVTLRVETARLQNANNMLAPAVTFVRAQIMGTYAFRYP